MKMKIAKNSSVITAEAAEQQNFLEMELRSGKKLPPVPNYGKNLVQELSQSKNRSSPNPESPVQDHGLSQNQNPGGIPIDRGAVGAKRSYPTREITNACWSNISG
ncbi:hypothetical protein PVK06_008889 [Gossypium arboreum]|uniref:Uncharacterized protein n=1 Tax=Gossypium arboreum TaxID=29729 RepID=A0ABR0QMG2_GOSAR|nr:hypothetical protein PVK06_008889 [Gossypium arboreum]